MGDKQLDTDYMDRRKKTLSDYAGSFGGVGSAGIGVLILNLLMHQNSVLDTHSDLIKDNKESQAKVMGLLQDMKSEFTLDINTFKLKHANLEHALKACEDDQREMTDRLAGIERQVRNTDDWDALERRLRLWAENTFVRQGAKK